MKFFKKLVIIFMIIICSSCNISKSINLNDYLSLEYLFELDNEEQGKYNCSVKATWFSEPESIITIRLYYIQMKDLLWILKPH